MSRGTIWHFRCYRRERPHKPSPPAAALRTRCAPIARVTPKRTVAPLPSVFVARCEVATVCRGIAVGRSGQPRGCRLRNRHCSRSQGSGAIARGGDQSVWADSRRRTDHRPLQVSAHAAGVGCSQPCGHSAAGHDVGLPERAFETRWLVVFRLARIAPLAGQNENACSLQRLQNGLWIRVAGCVRQSRGSAQRLA